MHRLTSLSAVMLSIASVFTGCQSAPATATDLPPLRAMDQVVDVPRFMGDWYVIAHIPTFIEKEAYHAIERYELDPDGTIATTFFFNQGSLNGPLKTYRPRGFIHNRTTNAEWRMRFIWPFKAAYLILYLDETYETTIIGIPSRRYAWIMARSPQMSEGRYTAMVERLAASGHDVSKLRRVPFRS